MRNLHIQIIVFLFFLYISNTLWTKPGYCQYAMHDSLKLQTLLDSIEIANKESSWDKSIDLATQAIEIANKLEDKKSEAFAYQQRGSAYFYKGLTVESLENYHTSYQIRSSINYRNGMATSLNNIGRAYMNLANYPLALSYFLRGLKISEELHDTSSSALLLYNIGVISYHRKEFDKALMYLGKSEEYATSADFKRIIGNIHKTRGTIYTELNNFTAALNEYSLALTILTLEDEKADHAALLNNIGYLFFKQGDYNLALKNHFESLEIKRKSNNQRGLANSYHSIGETYMAMGNASKALEYAKLALKCAQELSIVKLEESTYNLLSNIYSHSGNYKEAYRAMAKRFVLYDSINNDQTNRNMMQMELSYEFEKKLQQQETDQKHRESILIEKSRRNLITRNSLIIVICLISILVAISSYSYIKIRRDNQMLLVQKREMEMQNEEMESQRDSLTLLNTELQQKTEEIMAQRDEIEFQRDLVTMQKREITDSIIYAQRIQQAILPNKQTLDKLFPESFILYKPKNVVSGDFYWVSKIGKYRVIAVADCTGHGVPGGFMSMLGIAFLNEIVNKSEITSSSQVLEQMREFVIDSLHQTDPMENFDGMDMSFCAINDESLEMQFAGANSSAFISRKDLKEGEEPIQLLTGNRMPVSRHIRMDSFTNTKVQLRHDDMIYFFTDGFHDQFGGQEGRKYNFRRFSNLIEAVASLPVSKQFQIVEKTFTKWKGNHYQVDDVLVMGVRV